MTDNTFIRVSALSEKRVADLNDYVCDNLSKSLMSDEEVTADKMEHWIEQLKSILQRAVSVNIKVKSAERNDEQGKISYDCMEKRREFNQEVMPQLDNQTIDTTKKRKHLPYHCAQLKAKYCKHKILQTQAQEAEVVDFQAIEEPGEIKALQEATKNDLKQAEIIKEGNQTGPECLGVLERTARAHHVLTHELHTATDRVAFRSDVTEALMASSVTPLRKKLSDIQQSPAVSEGMCAKKMKLHSECFPTVFLDKSESVYIS